jgi:hypothetical protein
MKSKLFSLVVLAVIALSASFNVSAQEVLNNKTIIEMVNAGFGKAVIIGKVKSSAGKYDLSIDSLMALKKAGIDDEIVAAMIEVYSRAAGTGGSAAAVSSDPHDPLSPHNYGVYLFEETEGARRLTQIEPSVSAQNRTGGKVTRAITPFGLGKVKVKANLSGTASKIQLKQSQPVFYFYLDAKSGGLDTLSGIPSTPNEFVLVKFNIRDDNRELTIAKSNAYGAKGGISDESVVEFTSEKAGEGIYKITPKAPLKNGEYAFYLLNSGNSNASRAIGSKFFDFGIRLASL